MNNSGEGRTERNNHHSSIWRLSKMLEKKEPEEEEARFLSQENKDEVT